jgi:DNA polymerase III subunit delta'
MSLARIMGHERPLTILRRALGSGRVAHAYLFSGPDGVGKATVAGEFAKALLCGASDRDSCDQCEVCAKVSSGNHPDVVRIEPEKDQIVVGQVREMQRIMAFRPLEGAWRVIIVDPAHDLNPQAANALLKALEEPPCGNVLILVARSTASLLPTVVSRCQVVHFSPLPAAEVSRFLVERKGWDGEKARRAVLRAQGSIGKAMTFQDEAAEDIEPELIELLKGLEQQSGPQILELAHSWAGGRKDALARLGALQGILRDLIFMRVGRGDVENEKYREPLRAVASQWDLPGLLGGWEKVNEAIEGVERNWNPQLVVEELLLAMGDLKGGERR